MENPLLRQLREILEEKKRKNPRFSLRAFARQTGVPAPTLSRLLAGRWNLTIAMARKLVRGMSDNEDERKRMLRAFAVEPEKRPVRSTRYRYLKLEELELLAHWGYSAILEWLRGRDWVKGEEAIAKGSGLTVKEAGEFLGVLRKLGLVERSVRRGWRSKEAHLSSIRWEGAPPWKQVHQGYARGASTYFDRYEKERASIQGITFKVAPEKLKEARDRIREFAEELSDKLSGGPEDELYRLNIQLFPLGS